jgi:hypothetical protein
MILDHRQYIGVTVTESVVLSARFWECAMKDSRDSSSFKDPFSLNAGRLNSALNSVVRCQKCPTARPMGIKTINPGLFGKDKIVYCCSKCGAETTLVVK